MIKKVKCIDLVFENCETARIAIKDIYYFEVRNVKVDISACNLTDAYFRKSCSYFYVSFNDLKNIQYKSFKGEKEKLLYNRLVKFQDITHIHLWFEDKTDEYIGVPWLSNEYFFNAGQNLYSNGDVYILEFEDKWTEKDILNYCKYKFKVYKYRVKNKIKNLFETIKRRIKYERV